MRTSMLLAGLLIACSTAGNCAAQEAVQRTVPFNQVLGTDAVDPQQLWLRLLNADYRFGARQGLGAYFESAVMKRKPGGPTSVNYWQIDGNPDRRVLYTPDFEANSAMLFIDNNLFFLEASRQWEREIVKHWSHALDLGHFADFTASVAGEESSIEVDLGGYFRNGSPTVSSCSWDSATLTLSIAKATGSKWHIKFRTPVDQRRFGTILSELDLRGGTGAGGVAINHRCFIVDRASPLRIDIGTVEDVSASLNAQVRDASSPPRKVLQISDRDDRKAAQTLSLLVNHLPNTDPRPMQFPDSRSRYRELLPGYQVTYVKDVVPAIKGTKRYPSINEFIAALVEELEIAQTCIETAIAPDGGPVDDPCLKWLALERSIDARMAYLVSGDLCAGLLQWSDAPLESRVALSIAISEFGPPIWATSSTFLRDDADPLLHAIVHARWGWLPTDAELEECFRVANDKDSGTVLRLAAIDSLVRWGKFEKVSEESLAWWFSSRLAGSDATCSSTIRCLARSAKGRALLCESYRKGDLAASVASQVAAILRSHATATLELKRFEFMPEAECRAVLTLCDRAKASAR